MTSIVLTSMIAVSESSVNLASMRLQSLPTLAFGHTVDRKVDLPWRQLGFLNE